MMDLFDLHCDTIVSARLEHDRQLRQNDMHIDLMRLPRGSRWAQAFALFIRDDLRGQAAIDYFERAYAAYTEQMQKNSDLILPMTSYGELEQAFAQKKFASLLTVEGGAALGGRMDMLDRLYQCGVRVLTLTWNGANELGSGWDTQNGLSDFGRAAVAKMEELGMLVDVSHLNDAGFADLCRIAAKPFIATHSNARSICGHLRNLTDAQFCEIRDRGGLVGMNYYRSFITDGGHTERIEDLTAHIHHFLKLGGADTLALGSDFDGADIPDYINGLEKVSNLRTALLREGVSEEVVHKIFFENARRFFEKYL